MTTPIRTFRPRIPLRQWAAEQGVADSTAYRWAADGTLNGSDADHPQAEKEDGVWWVWPDAYVRVEVVEITPDEAMARLVNERLATALESLATHLRGAMVG